MLAQTLRQHPGVVARIRTRDSRWQDRRKALLGTVRYAHEDDAGGAWLNLGSRAGVGTESLFRHSSTREALIEAVALRIWWMGHWSNFVATKRGMADPLQGLIAAGTVTKSETAPLLTAALQVILDAGVRDGLLRDDVPAADVTAALAGILIVTDSADQHEQAGRLLDLLMAGLRPR